MAASTRTHPSPLLAIFLIFAVAGLLWLVVVHSLVAYLSDAAPDWALMLSRDNPNAVLKIADEQLGSAKTSAIEPLRDGSPLVSTRTEARVRDLVARGVPAPSSVRRIRLRLNAPT